MEKAFEFYNYAKSWIGTTDDSGNKKYVWTAGMIFFEYERKIYLDKAVIIIGDVPPHFYNYFLNFSNWEILSSSNNDREFYYMVDGDKVRVDPEKVYLHVKYSWANMEVDFKSNPCYWNYFVSHPNDKIFRHVADQMKDRIKVIDCTEGGSFNSSNQSRVLNSVYKYVKNRKYSIKALENPLFLKSHYYGSGNNEMDQVLFTGLNTQMF